MRAERPPIRRVLEFYGLTTLTALSPLVALPAITAAEGADGFAAVVLGQTLGAAACTVILMGWGLVGPYEVATRATSPEALRELFWTSIVARIGISVVALPAVALAAAVLATDWTPVVVIAAVGAGLGGLTSSWFFTGLGRSGLIALYETVPLVAASVVGAVAVWLGMPLIGFPVLTMAAWVWTIVASFRRLRGEGSAAPASHVRGAVASLRSQWPLIVSSIATYAYTGLSVTIVAAVAPAALPVFAAVYRLQSLGRSLLFPLKNALQSWVAGGPAASLGRRTRTAVLLTAATGLVAAVGLAVLAPLTDTVIFSGAIEIGAAPAAAMGSTLAIISLSLGLSAYVLIPRRCSHVVAGASMGGAVVGVPLLVVGAHVAGATGAALGLITTELFILVWSLVGQRRAGRTVVQEMPVPGGPSRA